MTLDQERMAPEVGTPSRREYTRAELIELLGAVPMFARLPPQQRELIATAAVPIAVKRGETVIRQGDTGDAVYVVVKGSFLATRSSRSGERRAVNVIEAPGSFGEIALLDGRPRSLSIEALEAAELLVLSRTDFLGLLAKDPRLVDGLLRVLGRMIRRLTDQVADESLLDLSARVAKTLVRLIEPHVTNDPKGMPTVSLSQGKLAELAGGSRQSVNGALATLVSRNLVRIEGRQIVVTDVPGLYGRAGISAPTPPG